MHFKPNTTINEVWHRSMILQIELTFLLVIFCAPDHDVERKVDYFKM